MNDPNSVDPILVRVNKETAYIVDGHHRYNAFLKLGYERVPIKYLHSYDLGKMTPDGTFIRTLEDILAGAKLC
ncbi:ParB-like nuclease domain-containing protein [Lachnospiraceae bacterium RM5]|nr:ParB-like nuclease domain-containing protein [Lachnospiraceae bacterium RM5]